MFQPSAFTIILLCLRDKAKVPFNVHSVNDLLTVVSVC